MPNVISPIDQNQNIAGNIPLLTTTIVSDIRAFSDPPPMIPNKVPVRIMAIVVIPMKTTLDTLANAPDDPGTHDCSQAIIE